MKYKLFIFFSLFGFVFVFCQMKEEKEQRIAETDFPKNALSTLAPYLENVRRLRFYREQDGEKVNYECKFKKDRLDYSIEFNNLGELEDVEFIIQNKDIPAETWETLSIFLEENYNKRRIKKIQKQYALQNGTADQLLRNAFQNILSPNIFYEMVIVTKEDNGYAEYELLFTLYGEFVQARKVVNSKYAHVLY